MPSFQATSWNSPLSAGGRGGGRVRGESRSAKEKKATSKSVVREISSCRFPKGINKVVATACAHYVDAICLYFHYRLIRLDRLARSLVPRESCCLFERPLAERLAQRRVGAVGEQRGRPRPRRRGAV